MKQVKKKKKQPIKQKKARQSPSPSSLTDTKRPGSASAKNQSAAGEYLPLQQDVAAMYPATTEGPISPPRMILPVLPLRNTVVFPSVVTPLVVGRPRSVAAVEAAVTTEEKLLLAVAQREQSLDEIMGEDLFSVGTMIIVTKMLRTSEETIQIAVQGWRRVKVLEYLPNDDYLKAHVEVLEFPKEEDIEIEALHRNILSLIHKSLSLLPNVPEGVAAVFTNEEDPVVLAYRLGSLLNLDLEKQQSLLEAHSRRDILQLMNSYLTREVEILEVRRR
jgi:ATP-dependent Lon protease